MRHIFLGFCRGNKDSRYFSGIDFEDFVLALELLNKRGIAFAISYDGRLGNKTFGRELPKSLGLKRIGAEFEVICDRSTVPLEDNLKALERDC